ncbi:unnamed protein product [Musa acuminata subsp. burmannicoides]|uniref:(wild Malaysian banana) hypothetical protein n=1 Tax=Musa acuminata subsp. malaccensis TaxID=214687 RepID=A0A804HYT2_MUSAM|nr:unnamed protein product [Musa acuminata subsp. malaccensis]
MFSIIFLLFGNTTSVIKLMCLRQLWSHTMVPSLCINLLRMLMSVWSLTMKHCMISSFLTPHLAVNHFFMVGFALQP